MRTCFFLLLLLTTFTFQIWCQNIRCFLYPFMHFIYNLSSFGFHLGNLFLFRIWILSCCWSFVGDVDDDSFFLWFYLIVLLLLGLPFFSLFATMLVLFFRSKIYMQLSKTENECRHLKALPKNEPKSALDSVSHRFICCLLFYFCVFVALGMTTKTMSMKKKNKRHAQNVCMCWHSEVSDE